MLIGSRGMYVDNAFGVDAGDASPDEIPLLNAKDIRFAQTFLSIFFEKDQFRASRFFRVDLEKRIFQKYHKPICVECWGNPWEDPA